MDDVIGFTLENALKILESHAQALTVRIIETSGYRAQQDLEGHTDVRVVAVRETESETLLITARF